MFRLQCVCVLCLLVLSSLFSQEQLATRYAVQQNLFSGATLRDSLLQSDLASNTQETKSPALAAIYSLVLPGLGEYYAGNYSSGKFFSALEGIFWLTFAALDIHGSSLRSDARTYAAVHAGINPVGKNDQFYVDIGNFSNTQEYNDKRLRERTPDRLYDVNNGYGWQWDTDASRSAFKDTRISSEDVLNNRKFVVLGLVINHIASAVNAARLAILHNKSLNDQLGMLHFKADVMGGISTPHGIQFTLSRDF